MSQNSNQTVTTETLKALTNAPSVDEPLVSQDAFKEGEVHSARPVWKTPVVKLTVIGAGAGADLWASRAIFWWAASSLINRNRRRRPPKKAWPTLSQT